MAELVRINPDMPRFPSDEYDDFDSYYSDAQQMLEILKEDQPDSPADGLEGAILQFHVADGYAYYRVINENPLQLEYVPFLDEYKIPDAHVRGLREQEVYDHMGWDYEE